MAKIANHPGITKRPIEAAVLRYQSRPIIANLPTPTKSGNLQNKVYKCFLDNVIKDMHEEMLHICELLIPGQV
jgi:hypothetical protein